MAIGWKVRGAPPTKWIYLDKANLPPLRRGIKKVIVTDASSRTPGLIKVVAIGKAGSYPLVPGQEPLTVTVELNDTASPPGGTPGTDECGEIAFAHPPAVPSCRFSGGPLETAQLVCN